MDSSDPLPSALELDVRPLVAAHQPPMAAILETVARLAPGQAFRLVAPFEPLPLYQLLAQHGLKPSARVRDDGAWEITFRSV
jgi:uncharacterized protein (DUF2249 family)